MCFSGGVKRNLRTVMHWDSQGYRRCPDLCFAGLVMALQVIIDKENIQVARGQSAGLLCTFTTSAALTNLNIIWTVTPLSNANQPEQVRKYYRF